MHCPQCDGDVFDTQGNISYCVNCNTVVEENAIVSEVSFQENANGTSSVVGQFVAATGGTNGGVRPYHKRGGPGGAFGRDSRQATIENGRRRISQLAAALKLNTRHVEAAQRFFLLAIQHNFIQGRRTQNVVAACLYTVCRREKTPHMLIDFSDVLQTNVYVLGHTFLRFCRVLSLQLPIIDPSLYIQRFAAKLEFEDKTHAVANTALRLVQRMKRDWIQTGRRPAGICGAGLLIAARLHGFRRTQKEIVQVVRICDVTLRKRLNEFEETPTGGLTADEFEQIDLEEECDPPAFTRARKKDDVSQTEKKKKEMNIDEMDEEWIKELGELKQNFKPANSEQEDLSDIEQEMVQACSQFAEMDQDELRRSLLEKKISEKDSGLLSSQISQPSGTQEITNSNNTSAQLNQLADEKTNLEDAETFSDIDDVEVDGYLNTLDEVKIKSQIWHDMNKDYLEILEQKQKLAAEREKNPSKQRKRKSSKRDTPAETAAEAAMETLRKKVSAKINYQALEDLLQGHPFATKEPKLDADDRQVYEEEDGRLEESDFNDEDQFGVQYKY